jgi:hypothetical protein
MEVVHMTNNTTHVPNFEDWISYYNKTPASKPVLDRTVERSVVTQGSNTATCTEVLKTIAEVGDNNNITTDMQDIELVSPVQGAVQQARAAYERSEPIKSLNVVKKRQRARSGVKSKSQRRKKQKKRQRRKKKPSKKKKKKKKKVVKRLKNKINRKKTKLKKKQGSKKKKKVQTRDIFSV